VVACDWFIKGIDNAVIAFFTFHFFQNNLLLSFNDFFRLNKDEEDRTTDAPSLQNILMVTANSDVASKGTTILAGAISPFMTYCTHPTHNGVSSFASRENHVSVSAVRR